MVEYHKTVTLIRSLLDEHGVSYKAFEHEAVRTSEEAAAIRPEYSLSQGAKALIVRIKKRGATGASSKQFAQIVVPGDAKFNTKKACAALEAKDIRFATEEEVETITDGVKPGGVPPFGVLWNLPVYVEQSLLTHEEIIFNAGDRRYSIAVPTKGYLEVVAPTVVDII